MPHSASAPVRDAGLLQTAARLTQAKPLQADPSKCETHGPSLLRHHLEARDTAALFLGHVAVAERSRGERAQQPRARRVTASAPAALQDLGALVFSDHTLHLQQQVVLRGAANGPVQEQHLGSGTAELLHQQGLVRVAADQSVGREDIKPLNAPRRRSVAQPFQRWADQEGTAVALIDIGVIGLDVAAICSNPFAQRRDLAGDGVVACLALG